MQQNASESIVKTVHTSNDGILIQHINSEPAPAGCIVVVGLARGGTSAVAGALSTLGVYMGDGASAPVYEDKRIIDAIPAKGLALLGARPWAKFSGIAAEYSQQYPLWGFKYPSVHRCLSQVNRALASPRYIFVYRDILAISCRRSDINEAADPIASMKNCLRLYGRVAQFVDKEKPPCMHVSYEKMLTNSSAFAKHLGWFCGLSPDEELCQRVQQTIMPSPTAYDSWTQNHKTARKLSANRYLGNIQIVNRRQVLGWAVNVNSQEPLYVDIYIDNKFQKKVLADAVRPHLFEQGVIKSPNAGFSYLFGDNPPEPGSVIKVTIADTDIEIGNSGKRFDDYG